MCGGRLSDIVAHRWGGGDFVAQTWHVLAGLFALGCVLAAFNLIYAGTERHAPALALANARHPRRCGDLAAGIVRTQDLPERLRTLTLSYGSVDAVIVLLMWLYLSGIAVLIGAEVN